MAKVGSAWWGTGRPPSEGRGEEVQLRAVPLPRVVENVDAGSRGECRSGGHQSGEEGASPTDAQRRGHTPHHPCPHSGGTPARHRLRRRPSPPHRRSRGQPDRQGRKGGWLGGRVTNAAAPRGRGRLPAARSRARHNPRRSGLHTAAAAAPPAPLGGCRQQRLRHPLASDHRKRRQRPSSQARGRWRRLHPAPPPPTALSSGGVVRLPRPQRQRQIIRRLERNLVHRRPPPPPLGTRGRRASTGRRLHGFIRPPQQ